MSSNSQRNRQPKGRPTGGQFAEQAKPSSGVSLPGRGKLRDGDSHGGFRLKNVQTMADGLAFSGTLTRDGRGVAQVQQDGRGGMTRVRWSGGPGSEAASDFAQVSARATGVRDHVHRLRAKRNKSRRTGAWVDHLADAPRADLPDDRRLRRARWMRRYVWVAVILLVPSLLVNVFIIFGNPEVGEERDDGPAAAGVRDPIVLEARALATATVSRWLASEPSPLPGGRLMSWNYANDVEAVAPVQTNSDGQEVPWDRVLMHEMTVTNGTTVFSVRLTTSADPVEGVHVIGTPSLVPYAPASSSDFSGPVWPGAQTVTTSDSVSESINQWARAFTDGDPSALRLAVGDPDPNHAYMPMVGAELVDTNIVSTTVQEHMLGEDGRPPAKAEQVIVRVELTLQWAADTDEETEDEGSNDRAEPVTYDVLVDRANTASPDVVAWGGPGQGPALEPYANAVIGRSLQVRASDGDYDASDLQSEEDQDSGEQSDQDSDEDQDSEEEGD